MRGILLGSGPLFARDTFGPVLAFWIGWKVVGLVLGIFLSTVVALGAWLLERRQARPGLVRSTVRFALLAWVCVDAFVASNLLTGAPLLALLMTLSIWYGTRALRQSEEWGWAFEPPVAPVAP